jgi:hypothetical protein
MQQRKFIAVAFRVLNVLDATTVAQKLSQGCLAIDVWPAC